MTRADHTAAVQQFGYTAREASFIAAAALHSGYFLCRQFSPNRGKIGDVLCRKVLARGHATAATYAGGTRLYHLHAKPLYRALGQEDNRHRRHQDSFHLRGKVMGFDYVLLHPGHQFLPTEQEKLEYFAGERMVARKLLPTKTYQGANGTKSARFFVEKYPIAIHPETRITQFSYIDDGMFTAPSFPTWLDQYAPLIGALGASQVVYVATSEAAFPVAKKQFAVQFPTTSGVLAPDVLAYFGLRKEIEEQGFTGRSQDTLDAFRRAGRRYSEPKYQALYQAWCDAKAHPEDAAGVQFATYLLPHSYRFFGTLAGAK